LELNLAFSLFRLGRLVVQPFFSPLRYLANNSASLCNFIVPKNVREEIFVKSDPVNAREMEKISFIKQSI
jgi:hypothetical protein